MIGLLGLTYHVRQAQKMRRKYCRQMLWYTTLTQNDDHGPRMVQGDWQNHVSQEKNRPFHISRKIKKRNLRFTWIVNCLFYFPCETWFCQLPWAVMFENTCPWNENRVFIHRELWFCFMFLCFFKCYFAGEGAAEITKACKYWMTMYNNYIWIASWIHWKWQGKVDFAR